MARKRAKDVSAYPNPAVVEKGLMACRAYDDTPLAAKRRTSSSPASSGMRPGKPASFHHLITLPTYHETALGTDVLAEGYFGDAGMLAYVKGVQRREIRRGLAAVKHQDLAGSNIGDDHKEYFLGEKALLAGGAANTMNQF